MYPARTISVALFDCPHCVDEFAFDYQRIAKLTYGWQVRVGCPGLRQGHYGEVFEKSSDARANNTSERRFQSGVGLKLNVQFTRYTFWIAAGPPL